MNYIDTIIVGGGQAGLVASYFLTQANRPHIVFERSAHAAHAWRDRRWDSFTLVLPTGNSACRERNTKAPSQTAF
jgi:putative flavoprotein involved in K+ transport